MVKKVFYFIVVTPLKHLPEKADYLEICYLLLNGTLPNQTQFDNFTRTIKQHTMVHEQMSNFFNGFRRDAHPMAIMTGTIGGLSAFYHDTIDIQKARTSLTQQPIVLLPKCQRLQPCAINILLASLLFHLKIAWDMPKTFCICYLPHPAKKRHTRSGTG